jgi:hypothetical protein
MSAAHGERPVGHIPESDRSDWTEQDLLTTAEALPRLEAAITEVEAEIAETSDPATKGALADRLAAMNTARNTLLTR